MMHEVNEGEEEEDPELARRLAAVAATAGGDDAEGTKVDDAEEANEGEEKKEPGSVGESKSISSATQRRLAERLRTAPDPDKLLEWCPELQRYKVCCSIGVLCNESD